MGSNPDIHGQLCALLEREGAAFRVVEHIPEGHTELIARIRGNRLEQAIKSIVVQVRLAPKQNQYWLANVPGDRRLEMENIRGGLGALSVAFARREQAEALTGCVIGAIPPFSFNEELQVLADPLIANNDEVVFNAGRLDRSIFMHSADYLRIASPQMMSIASPA